MHPRQALNKKLSPPVFAIHWCRGCGIEVGNRDKEDRISQFDEALGWLVWRCASCRIISDLKLASVRSR